MAGTIPGMAQHAPSPPPTRRRRSSYPSLARLVESFLDHLAAGGASANTLAAYRRDLLGVASRRPRGNTGSRRRAHAGHTVGGPQQRLRLNHGAMRQRRGVGHFLRSWSTRSRSPSSKSELLHEIAGTLPTHREQQAALGGSSHHWSSKAQDPGSRRLSRAARRHGSDPVGEVPAEPLSRTSTA